MPGDPALRDVVVSVEQLSPAVVADADVCLRRRNDVGEQHRREHPVGRRLRRFAGEERSRLREQTFGVPIPVECSVDLDELRRRDMRGEPTSDRDRHERVAQRMKDERRNRDRRQYAAHID
ncbi:MAG TPA: hypothetical protein VGF65_05990, partial [Mycobacterium sp.]